MWAPKRFRRELEETNRRADTAEQQARIAERQAAAAAARRQRTEQAVARSHRSTVALQREADKNHWTELLQQSWAGR